MDLLKPKKRRRISVLLTNLALGGIVLVFEYGRWIEWNLTAQILEIAMIIAFVVGFINTYIKTGLWEFIHKPVKFLDEREIAVAGRSTRQAYNIFSVLVLSILFFFAVGNLTLDMVMVIGFIVFAHLLPASIIAWREKGDPDEKE